MKLTEALRNRRLERQIARHEIDTGLEKKTVTASYLGMSTNQIIPTQRLKFYWSVLGDCIEDRKAFVFRCTDSQEAEELKILTFSLVYQINDRWKVVLNGLELRAESPAGKEGGVVKGLEYSSSETRKFRAISPFDDPSNRSK
jgi:hypothetical protein